MHIHVGKPRDLALNASFGACSIIAEITQTLDSESSIELNAAERFLKRLQDWSASLPNDVRRFTKSSDAPLTLLEQEQIIGNIHVACVYYFAVMLVTRPFLISYLMSFLPGGTPGNSEARTFSKDQPEVVNLAQACIESAMYMAQISHQALQSDILLEQMCMLK